MLNSNFSFSANDHGLRLGLEGNLNPNPMDHQILRLPLPFVCRYHNNYINIRVKTIFFWSCGAKEIVLGPMDNAREFTAAVKEQREQHGQRELTSVQTTTEL